MKPATLSTTPLATNATPRGCTTAAGRCLRNLAAVFITCLMPYTALAQAQTAEYEIVFESTWSETTHPVEFPSDPHFSPLVGGTHSSDIVFWEPGGQSSLGIERMAELGSTGALLNEIDAEIAAGFADQSLLGPGIDSPGSATLTFTANLDFSELTLVSMIAPSPDWFIGVHGLSLLNQGWWAPEIVVDLFVYDAGTDHGPSYSSPNENADPALPIVLQGAPLEAGLPIGTFTITRVPEPAFMLQLLAAVPVLSYLGRRRRGRSRRC